MTKDPTPKEISGKYLVVWEKVRGEWKLAADAAMRPPLLHRQ
jgi:ketosteroid isomerase-like protein